MVPAIILLNTALILMAEKKENQYEKHFKNWLEELKKEGLVINYKEQPFTFELFPSYVLEYKEQLKTKVKHLGFSLLRNIKYTPDFRIEFSPDFPGLFGVHEDFGFNDPRGFLLLYTKLNRKGNPIVYVDIKAHSSATRVSSKLASSREFPIKQRVLLENKKVFVNKVIPYGFKDAFFGKTFTPDSYYYTDKRTKVRSVGKNNYPIIRIKKFIKKLRDERQTKN